MLRGDFTSRMNGYAIARQNGWMNVDEIREMEDMNKLPKGMGGDRFLCNGNMVDLMQAGKFLENNQNNEEGETENE